MVEEESQAETGPGKGKAFFDRGDQVADTGNWDFAVQMYLEGIRREPGNIERGHQQLFQVALKRKAAGGKPAGFMDAMKLRKAKDPLESLVNAEHLMAKDPGRIEHMAGVLRAAEKLELPGVIKWICGLILEVERVANRPNKNVLKMIVDAYYTIEEYASALAACDLALRSNPEDGVLLDMARDLSARQTIKQGQYDGEGSFVKSVRDLKKQEDLSEKDKMVQSREFLEKDLERARTEYEAAPTVAGKINGLAEALLRMQDESYENEAIDVLNKAFLESKSYSFKIKIDDVRMRQKRRRYAKLVGEDHKDEAMAYLQNEMLPFELEIYADRARNYPTDMAIKFELGRRQVLAGQTDEAIDTYRKALEFDPSEDRAKDLHYFLAVALKGTGDKQEALNHFSVVAQMDYNYRDVRQQIDEIRKELGG